MSRRVIVDVDQVVLHGFDARDRAAIGAALQSELQRCFSNVPQAAIAEHRRDRIDAGAACVASVRASDAGTHIARAVHDGMTR